MRRSLKILIPAAALALALPALAGHPSKGEKAAGKHCSYSKEECAQKMAQARHNGWLGIMLDQDEAGVMTITQVVAGSPAEKAGFRPGDVFYAVNGVEFSDANQDRLKAIKSTLKPGATASYTVKRDGVATELNATLGTMPDEVYNAWVAEHMKEHTAVASNK
jgi:S1-C subfamily serine protease